MSTSSYAIYKVLTIGKVFLDIMSTLVDRVGVETVAKSLLPNYCFGAFLKSGTNREPLVSTFKSGTITGTRFLFFSFFGTTYQPISSDIKWGTNPRY